MAEKKFIMGRIVDLKGEGRPPVVQALTGPSPKIKQLIDAAKAYKAAQGPITEMNLLRAALALE